MRASSLFLAGIVAVSTTYAHRTIVKREQVCDPSSSDPSATASQLDCETQAIDYLQDVCYPANSSGLPEMTAPCNSADYLNNACVWGAMGVQTFYCNFLYSSSNYNTSLYDSLCSKPIDADPAWWTDHAPNVTQRACICSSEFWVLNDACNDCLSAHGGTVLATELDFDVSSMSSSYCAATNTPTIGFTDLWPTLKPSQLTTMSTFSDPLNNATAVSLYYTPAVTGTALLENVEASVTISPTLYNPPSTVSYSLSINPGGEIVPTASSAIRSIVSASSSTSTKSGGASKETVIAAHVVVLAAIAALL